jgi:hypothetical protein
MIDLLIETRHRPLRHQQQRAGGRRSDRSIGGAG